jgi:hypothetical protein
MRNLILIALALSACSTAPRTVGEREMQGVFSADAAPGRKALLAEFLPDGRFGGDTVQAGEIIRTQGYWRVGAVDTKRRCTVIETKPAQGEWREGYCASVENERTALNCEGEGDSRTCLMVRKPRAKTSDAVKLGSSIPAKKR